MVAINEKHLFSQNFLRVSLLLVPFALLAGNRYKTRSGGTAKFRGGQKSEIRLSASMPREPLDEIAMSIEGQWSRFSEDLERTLLLS